MRRKYFIGGIVTLVACALIIAAFGFTIDKSVVLEKRTSLIARSIGHQLLLYAGDSSSRILPVKQLSPGVFQIEFQTQFSFMPDTLVKIVQSEIASRDLALDYMVSVLECTSNEVVYGFEISPNFKSIIPCTGRVQPRGCYTIQIEFVNFEAARNSTPYSLYIFTLVSISLVTFVGRSYFKKEKKSAPSEIVNEIPIGKYLFSRDTGILRFNAAIIDLSDKESKLLAIFADQLNQLISREELLKRVWEDDGVITGRSLDVFISKLRKKLMHDPSIQIGNVHGKGYKMSC